MTQREATIILISFFVGFAGGVIGDQMRLDKEGRTAEVRTKWNQCTFAAHQGAEECKRAEEMCAACVETQNAPNTGAAP